MSTVDSIRSQVLALPLEDRAALARDLLLSLETEDLDPDAEKEWIEVAYERAEAYARGETTAIDWRESVKRIRKALAERRRK